jgi:hypothetical protein
VTHVHAADAMFDQCAVKMSIVVNTATALVFVIMRMLALSTAVLIVVATLAQPSNKAYRCSEHVNSVMVQHANIVFTNCNVNA